MAGGAGPGEAPRLGLLELPAGLVLEAVIVATPRPEVGRAGGAAGGDREGVVDVGGERRRPARREDAGAVAHLDPARESPGWNASVCGIVGGWTPLPVLVLQVGEHVGP